MTLHPQNAGELEQQLYEITGQILLWKFEAITALICTEAYRLAIKELEQAHRAGGTANYDNATDEYIDERLERLQLLIQEDAGDE